MLPLASLALDPVSPAGERQALLQSLQRLESRSHRGRIGILQEAESCIQAARTLLDYRDCERREAAGRESLRQELRPEREALRERAQRLRAGVRVSPGAGP